MSVRIIFLSPLVLIQDDWLTILVLNVCKRLAKEKFFFNVIYTKRAHTLSIVHSV